ncbi:MAG: ATP-binding cassette domain-containing protein, partial [Rhodobiaceae bacterium]
VQGASGCGKSTLLGIICGTADAALTWSGDVRLNDRSISALPAEDRRVGLIFQDALLFPHMTVGDNLAFGLAERHRRERDTAVASALGIAGLEGFGDRDPATLSGGQAARVALMRTLLAEPDALLMDEAFSALDPERRQAFGSFVREQVRLRQIPALLVSHDAGDAVFSDGKPVRLG